VVLWFLFSLASLRFLGEIAHETENDMAKMKKLSDERCETEKK